ncbi:MAG: DUF4105 domain-containing protein [Leptospiraceae bacterium]|nr:DUF4105 domain-containing protein [Leptospiraceae bacterium]
MESYADGQDFFISPNGKNSPELELKASLDEFLKNSENQIECSFPARFFWLRKELNIDQNIIPFPECKKLEEFKLQMRSKSISILFTSFYPEHPASLFGHSAIKLNEEIPNSGDADDLVITYAASIPQKVDPFSYLYKGLTGGFPGSFEIQKFKFKIIESTEKENRDIWEFKLNLNKEEIDQLVRHLWEMQKTHFDYYFFNENCSFRILTLLEVARPELNLTKDVKLLVFPAEIIKQIVNQENLLENVIYYSSILERYKNKYEYLNKNEIQILKEIVNGKIDNGRYLSEIRRALVYDTAIDLYILKNSGDQLDDSKKENFQNNLNQFYQYRQDPNLLKSLSGYSSSSLNSNPYFSHEPSQIIGSVGNSSNGSFIDFKFRPVLRDFTDSYLGYSPYNQLFFLNSNVRYYEKNNSLRINEIHFLQMTSLNPIGKLLYKPSWRIDSGIQSLSQEIKNNSNSERSYGFLNAGLGVTGEPLGGKYRQNLIFYALIDLKMDAANHFNYGYRFGTKSTVGMIVRFYENFSFHLFYDYSYYLYGQIGFLQDINIASNLLVSKNFALEFQFRKNFFTNWEESMIGLKYYF